MIDLLANHMRQIDDIAPLRQLYYYTDRICEWALVIVSRNDKIEELEKCVKALEHITRQINRGKHKKTC